MNTTTKTIIFAIVGLAVGVMAGRLLNGVKAGPHKDDIRIGLRGGPDRGDGDIVFPASDSPVCLKAPGSWLVRTGDSPDAKTMIYVYDRICGVPDGSTLYAPGEKIPMSEAECRSLMAIPSRGDIQRPTC